MSRKASGLKAWVIQRVTAVYLALFVLYALFHFIGTPPADFDAWRQWLAEPLVSIAVLMFFLALLLHAWVGMRDVMIDYLPWLPLRVTLLSVLAIGLIGGGLWVAQVLFLARMTG